ncbi:MAG: translocation/assembly module TamB domain-containing protein [Pseudomonadota bacterium]
MRRYLFISVCLMVGTTAVAQDDDPSYLEGLIQDALSDTSRDVRVIGFRGALSSNATLEQLTIADDDGVWLSLEDASLVWSRAALLRGRLVVDELTAGRIELVRLPESDPPPPSPEDAEAAPFALPELPISIELGKLQAEQVVLGPDVLGEPATLVVTGAMSLIDGAADVDFQIQRTDRADRLDMTAAYANETQILKIDLDFDESEGGIISRKAKVPGEPSLGLSVTGEGPLSDFEAAIALASDGVDRFAGTVGIASPEAAEDGTYAFRADLNGDVRPLLQPDLHAFFGVDTALSVAGVSQPDGAVLLDTLDISTGALSLAGDLALAPGGLPTKFNLDGRIAGDGPIRLPTVTPATLIDDVTLTASYDEADGESWSANFVVDGFDRDGMEIDRAEVAAVGTIQSGETRSVSAKTTFGVTGLSHVNAALEQAIGTSPEGQIDLTWVEGEPIDVSRLNVRSGDASLQASARIDELAEGFPVDGRAVLSAEDISRFAAISGRPLSGAADLQVEGSGTPLSGAFDIILSASTLDLVIGEARVDPLLQGRSRVDLAARRDETGAFIEALTVRSPAIEADASGQLSGAAGTATFAGTLKDLSLVEPKLSGPAVIDTEVSWAQDGALELKRLEARALDAQISAQGSLNTSDESLPASGSLDLRAEDISRLAEFLQRPLKGAVNLSVDGSGTIKSPSLDGTLDLLARGLSTGIAQVDKITGGTVDLDATLAYGDGVPFVDALTLDTLNLAVTADADAPGEPITIAARLTDLGLVAPGINGPASLNGTVAPEDNTGENLDVDLTFQGPAGVGARIAGEIRDLGQELALAIQGSAPLDLANGFMAPNSITGPLNFDLRVDGAPGLSALSGRATISDARMSLPGAKLAVTGLGGAVNISGGQATPDISGSLGSGGQFNVSGPITLSAPYNANLSVALNGLILRDPELYQTVVDGTVTLNGPLTGGAQIGGALALGRTELRVPSGGAVATGALEGIHHVAEPASVRQTRARAGLIETASRSGPKASFPLDLTISAPNQIFVRGRGLDAELGGNLRLGGTTTNVSASGVFELIRGRFDILTKRLDLTEGLIDLRGALDPYLRFVAQTTSNEYTIDIVLEGLLSEPEITFSSSPFLPEEEVLAQLLFGRDFSNMSAFQAAQLVSAVATLSGKGGDGLGSRLGLANFDVTSTADGETQVSAGTYISDNIYSEVVADSAGRSEIHLNLDVTDSLTVKGIAGNDDTGVGVYFERDY